jgi:hypothetical protein
MNEMSYRDRFCRSGAAVRDPSEHDNRIRNARSADNRGSGDPRLRNLRFWITVLVPRLATCPFPLVLLRDEIDGAGTLDFPPQSHLGPDMPAAYSLAIFGHQSRGSWDRTSRRRQEAGPSHSGPGVDGRRLRGPCHLGPGSRMSIHVVS